MVPTYIRMFRGSYLPLLQARSKQSQKQPQKTRSSKHTSIQASKANHKAHTRYGRDVQLKQRGLPPVWTEDRRGVSVGSPAPRLPPARRPACHIAAAVLAVPHTDVVGD